MEKLTNKQQEIFSYIKGFIRMNDYYPVAIEVAEGLGLSRQFTGQYLDKLELKGYIERKGRAKLIVPIQ